MNICIICHLYPTKEGRGGYFFVEQLVNEFVKQGQQCTVIAPVNIASKFGIHRPYGPKHETLLFEDGKSYEVYRPRYYGRDIRFWGVSWALYECRKSIERSLKRLKVSFDTFYCHFFESGALIYPYAKKNKIPLFIASGESQIPAIVKSTRFFSIDDFRRYITGVICVSTKNKEESLAKGYTVEEKCLVIPNGVDLQTFQPLDRSECRKALGYKESAFIISCIGNFSERKGQERIVEAVQKLKDPRIQIVLGGCGYLSKKTEAIIYCGFIAHEQIPKYLSASDVYVIPTRWEGCCNSIIEAMACGLPIISSDRKFNWDVLNEENSILINPDSVEEISRAIKTLLDDVELRERLGRNALMASKELSIKRRASRIIHFMSERVK